MSLGSFAKASHRSTQNKFKALALITVSLILTLVGNSN